MSVELSKQKIDEVNALRAKARAWRIGAAIASVSVTVVFLLALRTATVRLIEAGPTRDAFVTELQSGLQREVLPQVKGLTVQTLDRLVPSVRAELVKIQARSPEVTAAVAAELELLEKNLPARAEKVLRASFGEVIKSREARVRALYPDLTEEKLAVVTTLLMAESEKRAENIANVVMAPFQMTVTKLAEDIVAIRESELVAADASPSWELAGLCVSLLQSELERTATPEYRQFLTAAFQEVRNERR